MKKILLVLSLLLLPALSFAVDSPPIAGSSCAGPKDIKYIFCTLTIGVINPITKVVIALAFLYFLWGIGQYLRSPGDDKSKQGAKDAIVWGLLGLFVMFSVWGLVNLITNTFTLDNTVAPVPQFSS